MAFHRSGRVHLLLARSIATGALRPKVAVAISAVLNLGGAFLSIEVAKTISGGIVDEARISPRCASWPARRWSVTASTWWSPSERGAQLAVIGEAPARSYRCRSADTSSRCVSDQFDRVSKTGVRLRAKVVVVYSTRGGISAW